MDDQELALYEAYVEIVLVRAVRVHAYGEDEAEALIMSGEGWVQSEEEEQAKLIAGPREVE